MTRAERLHQERVAAARARIEFDPRSTEAQAIAPEIGEEGPPSVDDMTPIPWPAGEKPVPATAMPDGESLPEADVLIVTWTTAEAISLSQVLTPGYAGYRPVHEKPGVTYWEKYVKNYDRLSRRMKRSAPAVHDYQRLGTYWTATVRDTRLTLFKSDSHLSQDGEIDLQRSPNRAVWEQVLQDVKPRWVITTDTGGGIGANAQLGDAVASRFVAFKHAHEDQPSPEDTFSCPQLAPTRTAAELAPLLAANEPRLAAVREGAGSLSIHSATDQATGVLTTAGFGFDDSANTDRLEGNGAICDMGDAVLGSICQAWGDRAPNYVSIRNVSDPQITSPHQPPLSEAELKTEHGQAGKIYATCERR
jgi:hypothetical protein